MATYKHSEPILEQLANVAQQKGITDFETFWAWVYSLEQAPGWFTVAIETEIHAEKSSATQVPRTGAKTPATAPVAHRVPPSTAHRPRAQSQPPRLISSKKVPGIMSLESGPTVRAHSHASVASTPKPTYIALGARVRVPSAGLYPRAALKFPFLVLIRGT